MLTINVIGCGRLGQSLARLIKLNQAGSIQGVMTAHTASAAAAVQAIGEGIACVSLNQLPPADIYLITTPDDLIQAVASQLTSLPAFPDAAILVHCSGSLPSAILKQSTQYAVQAVSVHPVKSFANPDQAVNTFNGTDCAIEGDASALPIVTQLFEKIGGRVFVINKAQKSLYHAASVFANNYLVTLHYQAVQAYLAAGVKKELAMHLVDQLMRDALNNVAQSGHQQGLTGPLRRKDAGTIRRHLDALEDKPTLKMLYLALAEATLPLITEEFTSSPSLHAWLVQQLGDTDAQK